MLISVLKSAEKGGRVITLGCRFVLVCSRWFGVLTYLAVLSELGVLAFLDDLS